MRALVLGATGETGKEVLKCLRESDSVDKVVVVGRRKVDGIDDADGKVQQKVVDFDNLDASPEAFADVDAAFCCLGTTRSKAGKEGFIKVDHDYVVNSATKLKSAGCKDFHLLTSKGTDKNSFFLYPQTKGKAEEAVKALSFERTSIYRPGLLMCDRQESRMGERMMRCVAGALDRGQSLSIRTDALGKAMVDNSFRKMDGEAKVETLEHADIMKIVKGKE